MIPEIDAYSGIKEELKFFTTSGVRVKLLISLNKERMMVDQMKTEFGYRTSTILPVLAELKSKELIYKKGGYYDVTPFGRLVSTKLIDFIETLHMFKTQEQFWKNHETYGIPDLFFRTLGSLSRSRILKPDTTDILAVYANFAEMLGSCRVIDGVSPFMYHELPGLFKRFTEQGVAIRLVVTRKVLELMRERYNYLLELSESVPNFSMRVIEDDLKVAFTVTENILSLGFFRQDGTYDYSTDLVSEDAAAIEWGNALFEYYWNRSTDINAVPLP